MLVERIFIALYFDVLVRNMRINDLDVIYVQLDFTAASLVVPVDLLLLVLDDCCP